MALYQIEICGPRNEYVVFHPTQQRLRGRWDFAKTAHRNKTEDWIKELAFTTNIIPGMAIGVETEKMRGRISDLLSIGDGAAILQKCNEIRKRFDSGFEIQQAHAPVEYPLTVDGVKEWCYWMRRLVDAKLAVELPGSNLPALETIQAWPGKRRRDPACTLPQTLKAPNDQTEYGLYPWADEVPVEPHGRGKSREPAPSA